MRIEPWWRCFAVPERTPGSPRRPSLEHLGKRQSYVSKVERGERLLDPVELRWWCRGLGVDTADFVREWERRLS